LPGVGSGRSSTGGGPTRIVMAGPDDSVFCITDRNPDTDLLP
jgi:hypothetical protein